MFCFTSKNFSFYNKNIFKNDFEFIVGSRRFPCTKQQACFLSSIVQKRLKSDPTFSSYKVNIDDPNNYFQQFYDLLFGKPLNVTDDIKLFAIEIGAQLGNEELISHFSSILFKKKIALDNSIIRLRSKICLSLDPNPELAYIASNFTNYSEDVLMNLGYDILEMILTDSRLVIETESWLFNFLLKLIMDKGDAYKPLLSTIQFEFLTRQEMKKFLNIISAEDISSSMWSALKQRLILNVNVNKESSSRHSSKAGEIKIPYDPQAPNNGIIHCLMDLCKGDPCERGELDITASSISKNNEHHLIEYSSYDWLVTQEGIGQHILFNFRKKKVYVNSYTLATCCNRIGCNHPKSWDLYGSNDLETWDLLDRRKDDTSLNGNRKATFQCLTKKPQAYQFIKLQMTGKNHNNNTRLVLSSVEFYGSLFTKDVILQ